MIFADENPRALAVALPAPLRRPAEIALEHIRHGTFQRSMSLLVMGTSLVSGLEVGYEHYRGCYSNPVMYTPVILSGVLTVAGGCAFFSRRMARSFLRYTAWTTLADGLIGFGFHIRGVARKPGGWRMPIVNIVMGPPLFAPVLFGTSAYLGVIASYLQREEDHGFRSHAVEAAAALRPADFRREIETGQFQKHFCVVTAVATICCGLEVWYSHYKDNFKYRVQWSPVLLAPVLVAAAIGGFKSKRIADTALPIASAAAMVNGMIGSYYHVRGILKRPGGKKKPVYNVLYGPPIFAPMLFAACGLFGMMAYLMRREKR
jgi:hypothetical protein